MGDILMFAIFDDLESFNLWHNGIKLKLNYPIYGIDGRTGQPNLDYPIENYTAPQFASDDERVVAWVGDEVDDVNLIDITLPAYRDFNKPSAKPAGNYVWDEIKANWING
jgi:hypothetical protein